ncbi:hypothetical protein FH972_006856 [Carpinus fangiana]|uniref:Uncharacterized protein n=1 Tax=Carpinus fangiana TaxID=176857 RepID=A0A5N6QVE7_9ROSI|nr:hypothetical protein FH972_006856 [Carpinus fangiana]
MGEAKLDDEAWLVTHGPGQTRRRGMVDDHCGEGQQTGVWEPEYGSAEEGSTNLLRCLPCIEVVAGLLTHGPRMGRLWVGRTEPRVVHIEREVGRSENGNHRHGSATWVVPERAEAV